MFHTSGKEELAVADQGPYALAAVLQEKTAFLPDYGFRPAEQVTATSGEGDTAGEAGGKADEWPDVSAGKSLSGLVGAALTLLLAGLIGLGLRKSQHKR
jgi:cobalt/nickel transport system permease protein